MQNVTYAEIIMSQKGNVYIFYISKDNQCVCGLDSQDLRRISCPSSRQGHGRVLGQSRNY